MSQSLAELIEAGLGTMEFHKLLGLEVVRIEPPEVELAINKSESTIGLGSTLHGGAALSLIYVTTGAAIAVGSSRYDPLSDGLHTLDMAIEFRAAPRTTRWTATARITQEIGDVIRVSCTVMDNGGYTLAIARSTSLVVPGETPPADTPMMTDEMVSAINALRGGRLDPVH